MPELSPEPDAVAGTAWEMGEEEETVVDE
jgi:hypothetical protein